MHKIPALEPHKCWHSPQTNSEAQRTPPKPVGSSPYLDIFLLQRGLVPVVNVDGPPVVVLEGRADRHVVKAVQVQVGHGRDGRSKAGAARLVFVGAALRVGGATGLIDGLEGEVVLKLAVLLTERDERSEFLYLQKNKAGPF